MLKACEDLTKYHVGVLMPLMMLADCHVWDDDDDDEYFVALFPSVPLSVYLTDLLGNIHEA